MSDSKTIHIATENSEIIYTDEFDVIVSGYGGAGGCAALEASRNGANVLILERASDGGGSTALSSCEMYLGGSGGTSLQKACGFEDSTQNMIDYMELAFEDKGDEYTSIIVKALGDRIVEACAEYLHKQIRIENGEDENFSLQQLIKEKYQGSRPAHGYPSCPDHSEKNKIWNLLEVESNIGVSLTENFALNPAPSICGLYFFHPQSKYFNLGKINLEQFNLYCETKNYSKDKLKSLLQGNLVE